MMNNIDDAVAAEMADVLSALGIEPIDIDIDLMKQPALSVIGALLARVDELEEAARWRPISEPPSAAGEYLGWNGYRVEIVRYLPEYEEDETDWPWWDWYDDEINISQWVSFSAPPTEAPAP